MFQHVARFELPVSVRGDRGDSLEPPWGSGANVEIADGTITVTPTDQGKPLAHLRLCGPCANPAQPAESAKHRVRAGRHGRLLIVLDGTSNDRVVVDPWELPASAPVGV